MRNHRMGRPGPLLELSGRYLIPNGAECLIVPYKNGTTSLWEYFTHGGPQEIAAKDLALWHYRTFIVRDPIERLQSAWRGQFNHVPYRQLVDAMLSRAPTDNQLDVHLRPQTAFLLGLEPTRVMTLPQFSALHPGMPALGGSGPRDVPQGLYRADELRAYYADDYTYVALTEPTLN